MTDSLDRHLKLDPPAIGEFKRISPSRYAAMKACLLREAWATSGNSPLLPPSPRAELGSISHRIFEAVGKGELSDADDAKLDELWDTLVLESEARMEKSDLTRHQVPLRLSVPDFQVRKLRTLSRAIEISSDSHKSSSKSLDQSSRTTGFEMWVESDDGSVGGFIDRARMTRDGVVLCDYKSGTVLKPGLDENASEIKSEYRDQMELYAAIYWQSKGSWPARLEVTPIQGDTLEINFDQERAKRLLDESKAFFKSANNRIASLGEGTTKPAELAAPRPEHCRMCLFRPACEAYWFARRCDSDEQWPVDVEGVVQEIVRLRNGRICLRVSKDESTAQSCVTIRNLADSDNRHPFLRRLSIGEEVAVYGLRQDYRSGDYIETPSTVVYGRI